MSLNTILDTAATGMVAQTRRLEVATDNLVNADVVSSTEADAYRARKVVFQSVLSSVSPTASSPAEATAMDASAIPGVAVASIVQSNAPVHKKYDPSNPKANSDGYVFESNVNPVEEMINSMQASQAFKNDVAMMTSTKQLIVQTLRSMET